MPKNPIFGPISSLMELNIRAKVQDRSSNITCLAHGGLTAWRSIRNSVFCSKNFGSWTDWNALWPTYRAIRRTKWRAFASWKFLWVEKNSIFGKDSGLFLQKKTKVQFLQFYIWRALGVPVLRTRKFGPHPWDFWKIGKTNLGGGAPTGFWGQNFRGRP